MKIQDITISKIHHSDEIEECAFIFSKNEPWISLHMEKSYFTSIISNPINETYAIKKEHKIAGVIILQLNGPFPGYVKSIVIDSDFSGKGLGRMLLEFAEKRIFEEYQNVFLCVSSFNTEAKKFYEKLGYIKVGELNDYLIRGESEILMRKTQGPIL